MKNGKALVLQKGFGIADELQKSVIFSFHLKAMRKALKRLSHARSREAKKGLLAYCPDFSGECYLHTTFRFQENLIASMNKGMK